jgi:hypothetical protein
MLNQRQNFLETIKPDGKPDRLVKQYEGTAFLPGDPVWTYVRGERHPGMAPTIDKWGTTIVWPAGAPGAMALVTVKTKVIRDVRRWRDFTKVPDLVANCSDQALWTPYLERVAKVDREKTLVMAWAPTGLFEQLHFLMGIEDTLINLITEPEAMKDLCAAIGEYRYNGIKLICDLANPDIILSHDDWGGKDKLFMSPDTWRKFIKPNYVRAYKYLKHKGVVIMHHADSFLEPIIEDMVELGIDIWQGALPQNDIGRLQTQLAGRMTIMGGIDSAVVDRPDSSEEEIRAHVRKACESFAPGGHFIPCITYGAPGTIHLQADSYINDEIDRYNKAAYGIVGSARNSEAR